MKAAMSKEIKEILLDPDGSDMFMRGVVDAGYHEFNVKANGKEYICRKLHPFEDIKIKLKREKQSMNNCKGLMGRLFGHKFESYLEAYYPPDSFKLKGSFTKDSLESLIDKNARKRFKILCKRCGQQKEVNDA